MKKTMTLCLILLLATGISFAQNKKENKKQVVKVCLDEMCNHCVKKINSYVAFEKGITRIDLDQPNNIANITFNSNKTDTLKIRRAFEKAKMTVTKMELVTEKAK